MKNVVERNLVFFNNTNYYPLSLFLLYYECYTNFIIEFGFENFDTADTSIHIASCAVLNLNTQPFERDRKHEQPLSIMKAATYSWELIVSKTYMLDPVGYL